MLLKISLMVAIVLVFYVLAYFIFRTKLRPYHAATWAMIEGFWYLVSFLALCAGLAELERIEKLDEYKMLERALDKDYDNKKSLLYAQSWILRLDHELPPKEKEGVIWFHKMRSYFEEGMNNSRWQNFLSHSRSYIHKEQRSDMNSKALEYGWPIHPQASPDSLYLKDEIHWVLDSLDNFSRRMGEVEQQRPEENTNYKIRYLMILIFLLALALKFLKIYADYLRNTGKA